MYFSIYAVDHGGTCNYPPFAVIVPGFVAVAVAAAAVVTNNCLQLSERDNWAPLALKY